MNTPTRLVLSRFRLPALLLAAFSCLQISIAESAAADPWLEEQIAKSGEIKEDEDSESSATLRKKSPQTLYAALMRDYNKLAETALSQRIAALQEAVSVAPNHSGEARALLEKLRELKRAAGEATRAAGEASSVKEGFALIEPYLPYYAGDAELRAALNSSEFARRIVLELRELGEAGEYDRLAALKSSLESTGVDRLLGEVSRSAFQDSLSSIIEKKWRAGLEGSAPLPGERFLVERMLMQNDAKLVLQLDLSEGAASPAARQLEESLRRQWGRDFEIVGRAASQKPDLLLSVSLGDAHVSRSESASAVKSSVPGRIAEEPNPDFMAAVDKYKKAAQGYETALKAYEMQYKNYIDDMNSSQSRQAQHGLQSAQASFNSVSASANGGTADGRAALAMAADELKIAEAVATATQGYSMPEPVKPYPHHLNHLETIYAIPSTIVIAEDSEPYEYTAKTLDYTIAASAELALKAPTDGAPAASASVNLDRKRSWTQNLGIDARDPAAGAGTFSEEELDSARNLFNLEFGAACAKKLDELLDSAATQAATAPASGSDSLLLGLSLRLREAPAALSDAELRALAALAQRPDVSPQAFRRDCLYEIAKKLAGGSGPTREQIEQTL